MRKLAFGMNLSLDGYIAAPGDDIGWSLPSDELFQWWSDRVGATGLALYGRKLWETMSSTGRPPINSLAPHRRRSSSPAAGVVTEAATRAAELEKSVMSIDPVRAEAVLNDLFSLRHDLQTIRTNAAQTHELYVHLIDTLDSQEGLMRLNVRRLNDLRLGFSHLRNTVDLEREYLQEVLDLLQTRVSTELNRFVRKITAWGTIGIAWTVIVGVYGMNFDDIPGLGWRFGYAFAFGLMAVVGVVLAVDVPAPGMAVT